MPRQTKKHLGCNRNEKSSSLRSQTRMLLQRERLLRFFGEFFKSRIATERVPKRHQFQLAIAEVAWVPDRDGELFACEILIANPRSDHRQILDHCDASERILPYRTNLQRTTAFAQRVFFAPKCGID